MKDIKIRKVDGGYVITGSFGDEKIVTSIEELFKHLLLIFEGLSDTFSGDSFGKIKIKRHQTRTIEKP